MFPFMTRGRDGRKSHPLDARRLTPATIGTGEWTQDPTTALRSLQAAWVCVRKTDELWISKNLIFFNSLLHFETRSPIFTAKEKSVAFCHLTINVHHGIDLGLD